MIERITARNGSLVLRHDGRLLASRYEPEAEAEAWIERRLEFLEKVRGVFILGAGCGYHVRAVRARTTAKILVIERSAEVADAVRQLENWPRDVRIETPRDARTLRASEAVRECIQQSFLVLLHPPSVAADSEFYRACAAQLKGRDWGALNWQWRLKDLPDLEAQPRVQKTEEPLTVYDLEQTELVQNSAERERLLIKALRELVK